MKSYVMVGVDIRGALRGGNYDFALIANNHFQMQASQCKFCKTINHLIKQFQINEKIIKIRYKFSLSIQQFY